MEEQWLIDLRNFVCDEPDPSEFIYTSKGIPHTEETKKKMKGVAKNRMAVPGVKEKISNTLKGRPFTEERKQNVSDALYRQKFQKYAKFYEFEWRGQIIKEFNTVKQLSKKYNIPKTTLLRKLGRTK
jgi:hypothetical protein